MREAFEVTPSQLMALHEALGRRDMNSFGAVASVMLPGSGSGGSKSGKPGSSPDNPIEL